MHLDAPTRCRELLRFEKEGIYFEEICWKPMRKNGELLKTFIEQVKGYSSSVQYMIKIVHFKWILDIIFNSVQKSCKYYTLSGSLELKCNFFVT